MIERLREYRLDGKVIEEGFSIADTAALGPISLVTRVQWTYQGEILERSNPHGVFMTRLKSRDALVCIEPHDAEGGSRTLLVLNPDGSIRFEVPNNLEIGGVRRDVVFSYAYPNLELSGRAFAVVVATAGSDFKVFIDFTTGEILKAFDIR